MPRIEFSFHHFVFRPTLLGTLLTVLLIPLFVHFGLWQYHKAEQKQAIQAAYNASRHDMALAFSADVAADKQDAWNYKKVSVQGEYDTQYQILLDNQVEAGRVGYHVITPLKIAHSTQYVLVNRGWVLGKDTHSEVPTIETPKGLQTIVGQVWLPSKKIFTLEATAPAATGKQAWPTVWQYMDMDKYRHLAPISTSAMAIKLDPESKAGGFVRNWQVPADRIATHIGYAYQWFGFAVATLLIYIYMSVSRIRPALSQELS